MATGEMIGTLAGFGAGFIPPLAPLAPFLPEIGATVGGMIEGGINQGKTNKMDIPLVDPMQVDYLRTLTNKRKALETGTAYQPQQDLIKELGGKAQENILQLSGGDIGSAVANTMAVNRSTGKNLNELFGEMNIEGLKLDAMIGELIDTIASRKLGVQNYKKQQADLLAAQQKQDAMRNLYALIAKMGGSKWMKDLFKKGNSTNTLKTQVSANPIDNFSLTTPTPEVPLGAGSDLDKVSTPGIDKMWYYWQQLNPNTPALLPDNSLEDATPYLLNPTILQ